MENFENKIERETGANIELVLHVMRHGDKTPDGVLEDYGKETTIKYAKKNSSNYGNKLRIKAFGSPAGPKSEKSGMQRALETAHIYADETRRNRDYAKLYSTRARSLLNYEDWDVLTIDPNYDYDAIFNQYLDEYLKDNHEGKGYDELTEEEQKKASFYASGGATRYYMELDTEDAIMSRKEVAGTFAILIQRYVRMIKEKLKSNQNLLFPIGSHTGTIEPFLAETVIWGNKDGNERHGATLEEIGGIFKPSEGFDIVLKTNQNGELERVQIRFDDQSRLGDEVYLDMQKVDELAEFYRKLHKKYEEEQE